jgi:hypothetical protein
LIRGFFAVRDLMAWTPKALEGFFVAAIKPERALWSIRGLVVSDLGRR